MFLLSSLVKLRMIHEKTKTYIFDLLRWVTLLLYPYYRCKNKRVKKLMLVLGAGGYYARGWLNLEINPFFKKDIFYDFRNPLPFADSSVDAIYSAHVFEHLYMNEFQYVLKECRRVLKPGGVFRVCLPCLRKNVEAYLKGDSAFFQWEPEGINPFRDFTMAGKFSRNVMVDGAHKNMYDFESLQQVLQSAGFKDIRREEYRVSRLISREELEAIEPEELKYREWNSFVAEARG